MKRLPIVESIDGKRYFADHRLSQLRNIENPHDFLNFNNAVEMELYILNNAVIAGLPVNCVYNAIND